MMWDPAQDEVLKKLWDEGHSCSVIARMLGVQGHGYRSRNAIIGRVHRLGLNTRNGDAVRKQGVAPLPSREGRSRVTTTVKAPTPLPPPEPTAAASGPIRDFPGAGHCRFIYGDVGSEWRCCGAPTPLPQPWCDAHRRIVYQRTPATPEARTKSRDAARAMARTGM